MSVIFPNLAWTISNSPFTVKMFNGLMGSHIASELNVSASRVVNTTIKKDDTVEFYLVDASPKSPKPHESAEDLAVRLTRMLLLGTFNPYQASLILQPPADLKINPGVSVPAAPSSSPSDIFTFGPTPSLHSSATASETLAKLLPAVNLSTVKVRCQIIDVIGMYVAI